MPGDCSRVVAGLFLLALFPGVAGEDTDADLIGIIVGSVVALLVLIVGMIVLVYICYRRSDDSPSHPEKSSHKHGNSKAHKHKKPRANGLPPPRVVYSAPRMKGPRYCPQLRIPAATKGTELAIYNPRILQPYAVRQVAYVPRPYPATVSSYYLRPGSRQPVVYARDNVRHTAYSQGISRQSVHIASKDVYTDVDANKLHIREVESVEGQMHLSDEEHEGHVDIPERRRRSRSNSNSSSASKSSDQHSDTFVPSVRPTPGDIMFSQPGGERRPSTGESPQPPDYMYAQVIKPHTSKGALEEQSHLRQTWQPGGIGSGVSPLSKTWHPNNVNEINQADLRTTMSERIERIVESGKKTEPVEKAIEEETFEFTGYPSRQSVRPSEQTRHHLSATMHDSRPSADYQEYSRVIHRGSRKSPSPTRRSGSPSFRSQSPPRSGSRLSKTTVDPTNGELYPYSRGINRLAKSQKEGPAPFSYIPIEEIEKFRQRNPSVGSKTEAESSPHYSRAIPREQHFSRSQNNQDYLNLGKSIQTPVPQFSGIPPAPPLPF
ncbi:hypothetical protein ScPMuIL_004319 [Solemya velum]